MLNTTTCSCIGVSRTQLPLFSSLCKFRPSPNGEPAMALKAASTHSPTSPSMAPEHCPTLFTLQNVKLNVFGPMKPFFGDNNPLYLALALLRVVFSHALWWFLISSPFNKLELTFDYICYLSVPSGSVTTLIAMYSL